MGPPYFLMLNRELVETASVPSQSKENKFTETRVARICEMSAISIQYKYHYTEDKTYQTINRSQY